MASRREIELLLKLRDEITAKLKEVEKHLKGVESAKKGVERAANSTGAATKRLTRDLDRGLNRALQQAARQGGFVTSALAKMGPVGLAAAATVGAFVLGLRNLVQESVRLTTEADKLNVSVEEYQRMLGLTVVMTNEAAAAGSRLSKAWGDFSKSLSNSNSNALTPYAEKLSEILETITKIGALKPGQSLSALFAQVPPAPRAFVGPPKPSAGTMVDAERATTKRTKAEEEAEDAAEKVAKEFHKLRTATVDAVQGLRRWALTLETPGIGIPNLGGSRFPMMQFAGLPGVAPSPGDPYSAVNPVTGRGRLSADALAHAAGLDDLPQAEIKEFGLALDAAADLAVIFGDQLGTFGEALLQGAAAGGLISENFKDLDTESQALQVAFAGAAGALAIFNATATGSQGRRAAGGAMAGASAGAQIGAAFNVPILGAAIGAGVGALVGWARGRGPAQIGADAGRDMGAALSQELMEAIHKSGQNAQLFLREIFSEGGLGLDRLAEETADLFSFLERGEITEKGLLWEMNELLPILIENFDELGEAGKEQIERILGAAKEMNIDLGATGDILERLAAGIPELTLEGFAKSFDMSPEQMAALQGLGLGIQTDEERVADTLDVPLELLKELAPALEELGVSLAELPDFLEASGLDLGELAAKLSLPPELLAKFEALIPPDPNVQANATGESVANHLLPGFRDVMDRAVEKFAIAVRDAVAQGT